MPGPSLATPTVDTLNTAIHMARRGCDVVYVTAVGTDPISDALVEAWQTEGIDTTHVHRHPDRSPGIYAIHIDDAGEPSFLYWRDRSAAREVFSLPGMGQSLEQALRCELVYYNAGGRRQGGTPDADRTVARSAGCGARRRIRQQLPPRAVEDAGPGAEGVDDRGQTGDDRIADECR